MRIAALLILGVGLCAAEEISVITREHSMELAVRTGRAPVYPTVRELELSSPGAIPLPEGISGIEQATIDLCGKVRTMLLARNRESSEHPNLLLVDGNGDGRFDTAEIHPLSVVERRARSGAVAGYTGGVSGLEFTQANRKLRGSLILFRKPGDEWTARISCRWYRTGDFKVGPIDYSLVLQDADLDGKYDGEDDLWLVRASGPVTKTRNLYSMSGCREGRYFEGARYGIAAIAGNRATVTVHAADGPDPADDEATRTRVERFWAGRLGDELAKYSAPRRRLAAEPVRWRRLRYDQARQAAAKEKKLLLVDLSAFWSVWSYRMGRYTYGDAEVATLISTHCVPIRIFQEQDHDGEFRTLTQLLSVRRAPAVGIWDPSGKLLISMSRWTRPDAFVAQLRSAIDRLERAK